MLYRYGSQTVYQIEYHFVWVTKYRYKVLTWVVAEPVRDMLRETSEAFEIRIIKGIFSKDHVHILVSCPPTLAPSEVMRSIKGRTSSKLFEEFPHVKQRQALLGVGLFLCHGRSDDRGGDSELS